MIDELISASWNEFAGEGREADVLEERDLISEKRRMCFIDKRPGSVTVIISASSSRPKACSVMRTLLNM